MAELEGWRWCPRCRAELRGDAARVECPDCGFVCYASSKPTAGALVEDGEGRLLLARRAREPFKGRWDIPGGFLEEGESPLEGLRREATLNLYWTARALSGDPQPADDVDELRWFAADELPAPDELAFENVPLVLSAWLARQQHA